VGLEEVYEKVKPFYQKKAKVIRGKADGLRLTSSINQASFSS